MKKSNDTTNNKTNDNKNNNTVSTLNNNPNETLKNEFEELNNKFVKLDKEKNTLNEIVEFHKNNIKTLESKLFNLGKDYSHLEILYNSAIKNNESLNTNFRNIQISEKKLQEEKNSMIQNEINLKKQRKTLKEEIKIKNDLLRKENLKFQQKTNSLESLIKENNIFQSNLFKDIKEKEETISKLNSILNLKDLELKKLEEEVIKKQEQRAEDISKMGLQNKSNESQLNDFLPMSSEINYLYERYINCIENYIIHTTLDNLSDNQLAPIIKNIFETSFNFCMEDFYKSFEFKSPNNKKLYSLKCLINSEKEEFINNSYVQTCNYLKTPLSEIHDQNDIVHVNKFIKESCSFIWTVILSQPEVNFVNPNLINYCIFSQDKHISLGPLKSSNKMLVDLIVIPSIYLNRDGTLLTKSYVLLKEIKETPIVDPTPSNKIATDPENVSCIGNIKSSENTHSSISQIKNETHPLESDDTNVKKYKSNDAMQIDNCFCNVSSNKDDFDLSSYSGYPDVYTHTLCPICENYSSISNFKNN